VILPSIVPALLTGFALAFARATGEYGSVIFIAGNMPMVSEITPLFIITKLEQYDYRRHRDRGRDAGRVLHPAADDQPAAGLDPQRAGKEMSAVLDKKPAAASPRAARPIKPPTPGAELGALR
jgi:hypothetical protein